MTKLGEAQSCAQSGDDRPAIRWIAGHEGVLASESRCVVRHLSPSIAPKRKFLAVDVTVNFPCPAKMSRIFKRLYMPETIEWE